MRSGIFVSDAIVVLILVGRYLCATALLVFPAGAAWAKLVAADLGLIARNGLNPPCFLAGSRRALVWTGKGQRRGAARRTTLLKLLRRLLGHHLEVEE